MIIILLLVSFPFQCELVAFLRRLSDSNFPKVSWTLLSILPNIINAELWMVFIPLLISNSSSLSTKLFRTIASTPITIGITVTLIFHSFFSSLAKSKYSSMLLLSFIFTLWSARTAKSIRWQVLRVFLSIFFSVYFQQILQKI